MPQTLTPRGRLGFCTQRTRQYFCAQSPHSSAGFTNTVALPMSPLLSVVSAAAVLLPLAGAAVGASPPIPLTGYFCPSCPSTDNPLQTLSVLPKAYSTVVVAFIGWDATGAILNQWDAPDKNFTLSANIVSGLQQEGRSVFMSLGGGAGNVLPDPVPSGFATTLLSGVLGLISQFGRHRF